MTRVLAAKVIANALAEDGPGIDKLSSVIADGLDGGALDEVM